MNINLEREIVQRIKLEKSSHKLKSRLFSLESAMKINNVSSKKQIAISMNNVLEDAEKIYQFLIKE